MINWLTDTVRKKIQDDGANPFLSFAAFLQVLSLLYGRAAALRADGYRQGFFKTRRLPCKVVSIGNLTVGGTGKTPMAIYVAGLLKRLGYRVVLVSRGYRGSAEKSGGIVSDGHSILMGPDEAGDEPLMIAMELPEVPVVVGQNRFEAGRRALERFKPDAIVLDDAFQHLKLARDLDLVLLDGRRPLGNGQVLPRGPLREPAAALSRADALILTRSQPVSKAPDERFERLAPGRPLFRSFHISHVRQQVAADGPASLQDLRRLTDADRGALKKKGLYAFSGIGHNDNFKRTLSEQGFMLQGFAGFPDHYRFTDSDLERIQAAASAAGCEILATTAKDFVRLSGRVRWPGILLIFSIETSFGDEREVFERFVELRLKGQA